jgi:predicted nucleic acid-binding protein
VKILFDTSVLVSALVDQLPNHEPALDCFATYSASPHAGCCTTHAVAETYATLTALPMAARIRPLEARRLVEEGLVSRLDVLALTAADYSQALARVSDEGLFSGIIYDALHLIAAERHGCGRLYTYNVIDFKRIGSVTTSIVRP